MAGNTGLIGKRLIDITFSSLGLMLCFPLLVLVSAAIRLSMGAPIFFRQERPGLLGQPFSIIKFRTMSNGRDEQGNLLSDSERLKALGAFLRSSSLDELPELFNVLKGDMSLVGPRPLLMKYLGLYTPEQMRRHEVKPGITGWAQINGRNTVDWEQRFVLDVWYVDQWSLGLDFRILASTVWKVVKHEGISQEGHATMEEFRGSHV